MVEHWTIGRHWNIHTFSQGIWFSEICALTSDKYIFTGHFILRNIWQLKYAFSQGISFSETSDIYMYNCTSDIKVWHLYLTSTSRYLYQKTMLSLIDIFTLLDHSKHCLNSQFEDWSLKTLPKLSIWRLITRNINLKREKKLLSQFEFMFLEFNLNNWKHYLKDFVL